MKSASKRVLDLHSISEWRKMQTGKVVLTNGCFDIVHVGHLRCLEYAYSLGDLLVVAINSDSSVKALKGEDRPYIGERDRAELVAGFACVDAVVIFEEKRIDRVISTIRPDLYAKGGDYTLETMDQGERFELERCAADISFFTLLEGRSTTRIIENIQSDT